MKEFENLGPREDQTEGELLSNPENLAPKIAPKSGWKTSQGQLTAVFVVVAMIFSAFGYKNFTVEKMESTYNAALVLITTLGPLVMAGYNLIRYTDSRGKVQSNTIWANADIINGPDNPAGKILGTSTNVARIGAEIVPNKKVQEVLNEAGELLGIVDLTTGHFHTFKKKDDVRNRNLDLLGKNL